MNNEYDENGNKLIHVKAYNRSDGTYVKEHWRGKGESFAPKREEPEWPPKEETPEFPEGGCFPNDGEVMYLDGEGPVLKGGVEKTDLPSGEGGVFGEVITGILELLPIIMQIIAGFSGGGASVPILKGNFEENMSKIKQHQHNYRTEMDNLLKNVVTAPNQTEYSKQFDKYVKAKNLYDTTQKAIYKAEYHVKNNDYKSAQEDIQGLQRVVNASFSIPKEQQEQMRDKQLRTSYSNNYVKQIVNQAPKTEFPNYNDKSALQGVISTKNTGDKLFYNNVTKYATPDAAQFWNLFSNNFDTKGMEYVNQNGQIVPSIKNLPPDWQNIVRQKVKQQTGLDDCIGIIFNENSSISKSIVNSLDFKRLILFNLNTLIKNGYLKNTSLTMAFNANNANSVGKIDIPIITMDKEGNLTAVFLDVYDFNKSGWNPSPKQGIPLQEAGIGTNYYSIILVKFSLKDFLSDVLLHFFNYYTHNFITYPTKNNK